MAVQIEYVKHPKAAKREMIPGKEKTHKTVFTRMSCKWLYQNFIKYISLRVICKA